MDTNSDNWDDAYSVIGEKGEIKFIDYEDDKSVCSYNPADEGPVIISIPFPFQKKKPQSVCVGEAAVDSITIENTTEESVELWKIKIYASNPDSSFTLSLMEPPSENSDNEYIESFVESYEIEDRTLQPHSSLTVWLTCKTKEIGLYTSAVHFTVGDDVIERVVFLLVDDKISQSLVSSKPYSRTMKKKKSFPVENFVPGIRANNPRPQGRRSNYRLPEYCIPQDVRETIENKQIPGPVLEGLSLFNYASYFKNLLLMEELKLEEDMRAYDMECVSMRRRGAEYLTLEVPGLAEKRPSLIHGDSIFAKLASEDTSDSSFLYQGYIHRVEADEVYLKFQRDFHMRHIDVNLYNVYFKYNRLNIRRQYHAIDEAGKLGKELLFPSECSKRKLVSTVPLVPISSILNEEQIYAVEKILGCKGGPPYVIHGPPGTGKTMTIVEAILQLYKRRRSARILVCASSNSAADHVLEKILRNKAVSVQENDVFRLNATTRPYEDVSPDHIRFCFFKDFVFKCLPSEVLKNVKIIISTYMSTSQLYTEGLQKGHFSHVFLDEAGQASEPETMVPISHLYNKETVVVLAGDPMQLGPVVFSNDADVHGLGKSYLERLFQCNLYCNGNEDYLTKLVRNYRCHRNILHLPSKLFYDGELIACKDETVSPVSWESLLPNQDFPVLFIGVQGCDEREGNNPSWFNRIEVSKVVNVIKKLTESGKLNEEDIGVITPYRQQVSKLKNALGSMNMFNIKVGSVEQFQGQEREVIIISTVRSTIKHNEFDRTYCLGFLSNPRRFNVAVTRARSLLIIIGNPHIICKDPFWNRLLWHCADNESYQGCALPERKDRDDEELTNEDIWQSAGENYQPIQDSGWGQCSSQDWNAEPSKDDTEWSGGWAEECNANEVKISSAPTPVEATTSQSRWGDTDQRGNTTPWWNEEPVTDVDKWSEEGWKC